MSPFREIRPSWLVLAGVLVLGVGLGACGRKGPLELPPSAAAPTAANTDGPWASGGLPQDPTIRPGSRVSSRDVVPSAAPQRSFLDVLID